MRASFAKQEAPLIVDVIRERNIRDVTAAIRNGQYNGAMAYDLHLSCLDEACKNREAIRAMLAATEKPVLALNYNQTYSYEQFRTTEQQRVDLLLSAAEAGASAVDIQAYTYDYDAKERFQEEYAPRAAPFVQARPKEIALNPQIIRKQQELIAQLHSMGTEVLMSCHTDVPMDCQQVVSLALALEQRGLDVVKIVTRCENDRQLIEAFKTMLELKMAVKKARIHYHCQGKRGKLTRIVNPMLGAYLVFCTERYTHSSNYEQLHLKTSSEAFRTLDWRQ
jgi:3-dehydroquinate dehydratase